MLFSTMTKNYNSQLVKCARKPIAMYFFFSVKNNLCTKVSTCVMAEAVPKCFSCKMFGCYAVLAVTCLVWGSCLAYMPERVLS